MWRPTQVFQLTSSPAFCNFNQSKCRTAMLCILIGRKYKKAEKLEMNSALEKLLCRNIIQQEEKGYQIPLGSLLLQKKVIFWHKFKVDRFKKISWTWSHHLHLWWKFKLLAGKFTWKQNVCWHHPAMFCFYTSSKLSMKVKVMGLNSGNLLKSFLLYLGHMRSDC